MADVFNVTAAFDKPAGYNAGDTMKCSISGSDVSTVTTIVKAGPITIPLVAADGAKSSVTVPAVNVTITAATPQSVVIDPSAPVIDNGTPPRTWVRSADGLSVSAVA